jgi:cob(I)alamin adenosyltransferase
MKKSQNLQQPETRRLTAADVEYLNRRVDAWHAKIEQMKEALLAGNDAEALRWAREVCGLPPLQQ